MTEQTITKLQKDVIKAFRDVFDIMNDGFMNKQYWDYITFGLAVIHLTSAELVHLKESSDYHIKYHIRLIDNALQFIDDIKSEKLKLFTIEKMPYDKGFITKLITSIEDGKEDNYFGVLCSYVSYKGLNDTLLKIGFSPTDHKVQSLAQIFTVMNDPNSTVYPEHATNDVLYHTIKDFPIAEDLGRLNAFERREKTLLEFLKSHFDYSITDGLLDLRESDWPDRKTLWLALGDNNPKDFKEDAKLGLIDKFFNSQKIVAFSSNKMSRKKN